MRERGCAARRSQPVTSIAKTILMVTSEPLTPSASIALSSSLMSHVLDPLTAIERDSLECSAAILRLQT
jgi:hypothetical protein